MAFEARAEPLLELAKSRAPLEREQLLVRIADLCESGAGALPARLAAEVEVVCVALASELAPAARVRLARRLAQARWAPKGLIETLAFDEIEAARPLIAESALLSDEALIKLLTEGTAEHRLEVARRAGLSVKVAAAIIEKNDPALLAALVSNQSADIAPEAMLRLVAQARTLAALAAPLARHPRMTPKLAEGLYLAGESLSAALRNRLEPAASTLETPMAQSVAETAAGVRPYGPEPAELLLVEKLACGGMLKPGYLLRTLREQRLGLFEAALAKLGDFSTDEVSKAIHSRDKPELLALACAAVGIDRSVFPSILEMVRQCNDGLPGGGEAGARRAASAFGPFPPEVARSAFRQAVASV
jgi:uncharacterized protein (DUF2336 family)